MAVGIGRKAESEQSQISGDLDIKEAISTQLPVWVGTSGMAY